jgi:hypothetical protein
MRLPITAILLAALVIAVPSARVKVRTDVDPSADFSGLKVWAWPADGPGQVKMILTKDDDPEALRKRFEPTILAGVEASLAKKGFTKAQAGQAPQFLVAYFALVSTNQQAQTVGQFLPGSVAWGIPPFLATTSSLKIYEQGSLVLDVMTLKKDPMWRGIAQAEMHRERPQAEREKRVREVIDDIIKEFPPKKKK